MWLLAATAGVVLAPAGASAAVLVGFDNESMMRGIRGFDTKLGTLNKVTLGISVEKYRVWQINVPAGSPVTTTGTTVNWTVNGNWRLGESNLGTPAYVIPITGSGTSAVTFRPGMTFSSGFFEVAARGTGSIDFDPAAFIGKSPVFFNGFDLGFNSPPPGDTTISGVPADGVPFHLSRSCQLSGGVPSPSDDDFCGSVRYTLTYDYTPVTAAVPEPATWAMMVLGFALAGAAMRRRPSPARAVA